MNDERALAHVADRGREPHGQVAVRRHAGREVRQRRERQVGQHRVVRRRERVGQRPATRRRRPRLPSAARGSPTRAMMRARRGNGGNRIRSLGGPPPPRKGGKLYPNGGVSSPFGAIQCVSECWVRRHLRLSFPACVHCGRGKHGNVKEKGGARPWADRHARRGARRRGRCEREPLACYQGTATSTSSSRAIPTCAQSRTAASRSAWTESGSSRAASTRPEIRSSGSRRVNVDGGTLSWELVNPRATTTWRPW